MTKVRCPWVNMSNELYVQYHDREWARPVHDDVRHFEMISLEGAQAGLSWETILNKRERYREVFQGFDPEKVAKFSKNKIDELVMDAGIVRHRQKISSTVTNAKAFLAIQKEFGSFDNYIWSYFPNGSIINTPKKRSDYNSKTELSDLISKDLKKRGFKFVGSTTIYAYLQAAGMIIEHSEDCFLAQQS